MLKSATARDRLVQGAGNKGDEANDNACGGGGGSGYERIRGSGQRSFRLNEADQTCETISNIIDKGS